MSDWKEISGGVTAPKGIGQQELLQAETFRTPDLALILSDVERAAGVHDHCVPPLWITAARDRKQQSARAILQCWASKRGNGAQGCLDALESARCLGKR